MQRLDNVKDFYTCWGVVSRGRHLKRRQETLTTCRLIPWTAPAITISFEKSSPERDVALKDDTKCESNWNEQNCHEESFKTFLSHTYDKFVCQIMSSASDSRLRRENSFRVNDDKFGNLL